MFTDALVVAAPGCRSALQEPVLSRACASIAYWVWLRLENFLTSNKQLVKLTALQETWPLTILEQAPCACCWFWQAYTAC